MWGIKKATVAVLLDYEQSLFFLGPSSKTPETRIYDHARDRRRETGEAAALVSRVSRLRRPTMARARTPLTKSEEKERLLALRCYRSLMAPSRRTWKTTPAKYLAKSTYMNSRK